MKCSFYCHSFRCFLSLRIASFLLRNSILYPSRSKDSPPVPPCSAMCMTFACVFQFLLSRVTGYLRRKTIVVTDRRVQMMNEVLAAIKLIKQYAWEATFVKRIIGQWPAPPPPSHRHRLRRPGSAATAGRELSAAEKQLQAWLLSVRICGIY